MLDYVHLVYQERQTHAGDPELLQAAKDTVNVLSAR